MYVVWSVEPWSQYLIPTQIITKQHKSPAHETAAATCRKVIKIKENLYKDDDDFLNVQQLWETIMNYHLQF